jgi:hypothetical protein
MSVVNQSTLYHPLPFGGKQRAISRQQSAVSSSQALFTLGG